MSMRYEYHVTLRSETNKEIGVGQVMAYRSDTWEGEAMSLCQWDAILEQCV